jgi:hypothetical protein
MIKTQRRPVKGFEPFLNRRSANKKRSNTGTFDRPPYPYASKLRAKREKFSLFGTANAAPANEKGKVKGVKYHESNHL